MIRFACVTLLLILPLSSYKSKDIDREKYLNFIASIENYSTFNYFTVIKVKDLNTGLIKEICSKGNFVSGALHTELNAWYDGKGEKQVLDFAKAKTDRFFEFKNKRALNNIYFYEYNSKEFDAFSKKYDFDKVYKLIEKDKKFSIQFSSDKEMKMFAHALFNRGILTGESDCFGGTLEYVDRNKITH